MKRLAISLICVFSTGLPAQRVQELSNADVLFRDDFEQDSLHNYVAFQDDCFTIKGGILKGEIGDNGSGFLNVFPLAGRNSQFSIDARSVGSEDSSFGIVVNTRYNPAQNTLYFQIDLGNNSITEWNSNASDVHRIRTSPFPFKKGAWHTFTVSRDNDAITLTVNGKPAAATRVAVIEPDMMIPDHANYGGYALYMDARDFLLNWNYNRKKGKPFRRNSVEFDNLVLKGDRAAADFAFAKKEFALGGRKHVLSVIFEKGSEQWAREALTSSIATMTAVYENVYRVLPDIRNPGIVLSRGKHFYSGGNHHNRTGILSMFADKDRPVYISQHELSHNWGALYEKFWWKEGTTYVVFLIMSEIVENRTYTLKDVFALMKNQGVADIARTDSTFRKKFVSTRLDADEEFAYLKGGIFCYILYRELGYDGWLKLHARIDKQGRFLTSAEIKKIAEEIAGKDLTPVFSGWVNSGEGKYDPLSAFVDSDHDGLFDLEEQLFGTNHESVDSDGDGYPDLVEIRNGFNPNNEKDPPQKFPLPGGGKSMWEHFPYTTKLDKEGDGSIFDITSLQYVLDTKNRAINMKVEFKTALFADFALKDKQAFLQFHWNTKGQKTMEYRTVFWIGRKSENDFVACFAYDPDKRTVSCKDTQFYYGHDYLEASIPLALFNDSDELMLDMNVGVVDIVDRLDGGWFRLEKNGGIPAHKKTTWRTE